MNITAWDKKREQYIPQGEFAITGDGRLLVQKNESILLYPPGTPSGEWMKIVVGSLRGKQVILRYAVFINKP